MRYGLPRRSTAIAAGVLLLSGAVSSCGFDTATNRVNTISSGINDQEGEVDVLGAAIISGAPDSGVFVGSLSNANPELAISLTGVGGEVTTTSAFEPITIEPQQLVSLYELGGVEIDGTIGLGDFIDVELTFDSGQTSTLSVAVMRPCYEYDPGKFPNMNLPGPVPEGETEFEAETEAGVATDEVTSATDPYSCEPIESEPHGEEEGEE